MVPRCSEVHTHWKPSIGSTQVPPFKHSVMLQSEIGNIDLYNSIVCGSYGKYDSNCKINVPQEAQEYAGGVGNENTFNLTINCTC